MRVKTKIVSFFFLSMFSAVGCGSSGDGGSSEGPVVGAGAEEDEDGAAAPDDAQGDDAAAVTNSAVKDKPLLTACYKGDTFSCAVEAVITRETNVVRGNRKAFVQSFEDSFVARQWSLQQANDGSISHDGFPYERKKVLVADFPNAKWGFFAENVAMIAGNDTDAEAVGKKFVTMWKNSDGHLKNMLGNYSYIGVGVARVGNNVYATQVFH